MAIKLVNELKQYFLSGKKPTQQQFWDLLESFFHKNDGIALANVAGLQQALISKANKSDIAALFPQPFPFSSDGTILVAAGTLIELSRVVSEEPVSIGMGLSNGGTELMTPDDDDTATRRIQPLYHECEEDTLIHVWNVTHPCTVFLYNRSLIPLI